MTSSQISQTSKYVDKLNKKVKYSDWALDSLGIKVVEWWKLMKNGLKAILLKKIWTDVIDKLIESVMSFRS